MAAASNSAAISTAAARIIDSITGTGGMQSVLEEAVWNLADAVCSDDYLEDGKHCSYGEVLREAKTYLYLICEDSKTGEEVSHRVDSHYPGWVSGDLQMLDKDRNELAAVPVLVRFDKGDEEFYVDMMDTPVIPELRLFDIKEIEYFCIAPKTIETKYSGWTEADDRPTVLLLEGIFSRHPELSTETVIRADVVCKCCNKVIGSIPKTVLETEEECNVDFSCPRIVARDYPIRFWQDGEWVTHLKLSREAILEIVGEDFYKDMLEPLVVAVSRAAQSVLGRRSRLESGGGGGGGGEPRSKPRRY